MNTERFYEGPGNSDMMTYVWEIALILFIAFLLGYLLRYILNDGLKKRISELEEENGKLYNASKDSDTKRKDIELLEIKIGEQKAEIDRLNTRLSDCFANRIKVENELTAMQNKIAAVSSSKEEITIAKTAEVTEIVNEVSSVSSPPVNKDDFKKIEGIGPKIEQLLNADGILSYETLIGTSIERIKGILTAAGPNYAVHDPATWGEQAKLANEGKWDALNLLQEEFKGGKRK